MVLGINDGIEVADAFLDAFLDAFFSSFAFFSPFAFLDAFAERTFKLSSDTFFALLRCENLSGTDAICGRFTNRATTVPKQ